jgi:acetyl esterase/lipase
MFIRYILVTLLIAFTTTSIKAQEKVIQLYDGVAPGSENWNWDEKENDHNFWNTRLVYNVSHPTLTVFSPDPAANKGTAVIICPGGAFYVLAIDKEGNDAAKWLAKKGITCFVLKYRLGHILTDDPAQEVTSKMGKKEFRDTIAPIIPLEVADGRAAIAYVRQHASEYKVSPDRIGIIGFSAGGTVTASTAFNYSTENRPNFVAPIYAYMPASLQSNVPADAPPLFLTAAADDQLGLAPHSVDLYDKWTAAKHSAELHIYAKGGHGFGMRVQNIPTDTWIDRFYDWLSVQGFVKSNE